MPTDVKPNAHADSDTDSDSEDGGGFKLRKDEYGERFEDYGFLKRAEDFKASGNSNFHKERYEKAITEYDQALDQIITVEHDKSITIGKRKFNDVLVMRSMIHLNISTCHFKMCEWHKSAEHALQCLHGSIKEQLMWSDPHIRQKMKAAEKKDGTCSAPIGEHRLTRATRAKAHFRVCQCYTSSGDLDRAKEAMAKALENCDDENLLAEISRHALAIDAREKEQKGKQLKQFAGFFDKLQDKGGYIAGTGQEDGVEEQEAAPHAPTAERRAGSSSDRPTKATAHMKEQLSHLEALDDCD